MSETAETYDFSPETVEKKRKFPVLSTFLLLLLLALQIFFVICAFRYQPEPQDVIEDYTVTVRPSVDGSLNVEYRFTWTALDPDEDLTWVEIGMANPNFSVYPESVSSNVNIYSKNTEADYVSLRLDFNKAYLGGEVFEISFKVNQKDMLCKNETGYFYEFVPSWFNAIRVEQYEFVWRNDVSGDYVQRGSLDYGEYSKMSIQYGMDAFTGCQTVAYEPFYEGDAYNELQEDKTGTLVMCCFVAAMLIIAEVYIVDCYVSYGRGRGFLSEHGYYVHAYGRSNPYYIRARDKYNAEHAGRSGGRFSGGGCACACACACAGGGRAGCSQKDTYGKE